MFKEPSNTPQLEVSVIVPVKDESEHLEACLRALLEQDLPGECYEVLVVDDGSKDETPEIAIQYGVRLVRGKHRGAAAARNRGVAAARGRLVLFIDGDCVAEPSWARILIHPLQTQSSLVSVGRYISNQQPWVSRLVQLELEDRYARMENHEQIDFINTGTCAMPKSLLLQQKFNEQFGRLEDIELSFRLAENDIPMIFVPEARVYHYHPETLWQYVARRFHYARYAPLLYRRFPAKALADSSTPQKRRWQLLLLAITLLFLLGSLRYPILLSAAALMGIGSLALSLPVLAQVLRKCPALALLTPLFILAGNLAFVGGIAIGLVDCLVDKNDPEMQ